MSRKEKILKAEAALADLLAEGGSWWDDELQVLEQALQVLRMKVH